MASGGGGEDGRAVGLAQAAEGGGQDGQRGVRQSGVRVPRRAQSSDEDVRKEGGNINSNSCLGNLYVLHIVYHAKTE